MGHEPDPLGDTPVACTVCDHGWVTVAKDENGMFLGNNPGDPAYARLVMHTEVYPCPNCDPGRFMQLAEGCFKRDHYPCERCEHRRNPNSKAYH